MEKNRNWTSSMKSKVFNYIKKYLSENYGNLVSACHSTAVKFNIDISVESIRQRYLRFSKNNGKERSNMLFDLKFERAIVAFIEC